MLECSHTADGAAPDKDKTLVGDTYAGMSLSDLIDHERNAKAKVTKKAKNKTSKGKAAKREPVVVEIAPPLMPLPPKSLRRSRRPKSSYAQRVQSLILCMSRPEALYSLKRDPETSSVTTRLDHKNDIENPRRKSRRTFRRSNGLTTVLRSEIALLDSSRSIAEAQTVAKLTELAFAFIPLTFACSIFSMQVTELRNGVPFLVTAEDLGMFAYVVRLVLQSKTL